MKTSPFSGRRHTDSDIWKTGQDARSTRGGAPLTHIDLFSGFGGFSLACQWNGIETEVFCEKDERCRGFLERTYSGIPVHDDAERLLKECQEFVHIAGSERFLRVTQDVSRAIRLLSESGETKTENFISKKVGHTTEGASRKSLITTVESAPVVGSLRWSSFVSITKTITEMRNGNDITSPQFGKSPSSVDSQMTTKSSATTATMQNRCMENVLIKIEDPWILTAGVPCQPASRAGKQGGAGDVRWLWPTAVSLVQYFNPCWCLFENPPGIYDVGLDGILADLERLGYEVGTIEIPACAVNSPQIRARVWIVAHTVPGGCGAVGKPEEDTQLSHPGPSCRMADSSLRGLGIDRSAQRSGGHTDECGESDLADPRSIISEQWRTIRHDQKTRTGARTIDQGCSPWDSFEWVMCADAKLRRSPDSAFLLAHGVLDSIHIEVGQKEEMTFGLHRSILAALGNSIVPQVAYEVIHAIKIADRD